MFPFPAASLSLFQERMLLWCRVSVVVSRRDLGTRYLSQLCWCVPLVSLSVVWPLVFLAVGAGPAGSCLPAVCGAGVVRPGWLVVPVSMLPCRFCLSLSLLFSLHPKGFPTTSQKCLIGHRICPVLFCLAVLAWQAGELGVPVLDVASGTGRVSVPLDNLEET